MSTLEKYTLWNYMLAEQCLLTDSHEGCVLLTVTPGVLSAALENAGEGVLSPEEAEADFVSAVAFVYKEHVLRSAARLRALKSLDTSEVPLGVGFLALSVLAAYHMRTDNKFTGRAYYARLAEIIGCELIGAIPEGFDLDAFEELWYELAEWLESQYGRRLALPAAGGVRKYVAYPLEHVPLRQVDIDRLPQLFDSCGYEPGVRPPLDRLAYDLYEGAGPWRQLTKAGRQALEDPGRRPFVIRQVAHELERWDGCRTDSSGTRIATIELMMDIRRRRTQLFLLARRPQSFPEVIENGDLVFESSQEGWYDPIPLEPDDGALLSNGLRVANGRYLLRFRPSSVVPLTPSDEYAGFVSDHILRTDTQCAVLCEESMSERVAQFLKILSNGSVYCRRDENLPRGWCLFTDVRPSVVVVPPAGLDRLRVESSIALIPKGGLRLGRRWTWLEGAPASLSVVGEHQGLAVRIDGKEVALESDGRVPDALLRAPISHFVEIGNRLRQRITVLSGTVNPECRSWECDELRLGKIPVAIPAGHWAVVGSEPGELENVLAGSEGALVRPDFCAQWAVKVSQAGTTVLHLHDLDASLASKAVAGGATRNRNRRPHERILSFEPWAEAIYQAGVRRPQLVCASNCPVQELEVEWRRLMVSVRSVKRQMRRGRR